MDNKTIYALSTVLGKSGVAIIRISGKEALQVVRLMTNLNPNNIKARYAYFTDLKDLIKSQTLDKCLLLYFKAPNSFTGEDIVELQIHGSRAVISSVLNNLSRIPEFRMAEPGGYSKRAFYNQKMDLTEAEGLADLIDAETEAQQKYALRQMEGSLKNLYDDWRTQLVTIMAHLEAYIDFPEEDIPEELYKDILNTVFKVKKDIKEHLDGNTVNERLKNGFKIVISGEANAGKSSLINALVKRNAVIVSDIAGTTRDAIDINLDIGGYPVVITDTAGIRKTENPIEKQGIEIAFKKIDEADIVIALYDASATLKPDFGYLLSYEEKVIYVANKMDKLSEQQKNNIISKKHLLLSAKYNNGLENLGNKLLDIIKERFTSASGCLITRLRYRQALEECCSFLEEFSLDKEIELSAEDIRLACRAIGKITGVVEVDEILNNIFGSFCIGK